MTNPTDQHTAENDAPFLDFDGVGDLTVWRTNPARPDYPEPIVRQCDVSPDAWGLLIAGVAAGRALAEWDEWNPFHGSFREAASLLREQIDQVWVRTCQCGKPAEHVQADPDSQEWACLVPAFDRQTGRIIPPGVGA
jgi:hypothetical protein